MDTEETKARAEHAAKFASKLSDEELKKKKANEPSFTLATYVTRKKTVLARGVEFEDVKTEQSDEPFKEGLVYTHFFPQGIIEQTVIHLKDNSNHHSTLIIAPTVGRTTVIEHFVPFKEALLEP